MELAGNLRNINEVVILTRLSKREIYNRMKEGVFPRPILQEGKNYWLLAHIETYLQNQVNKSKE